MVGVIRIELMTSSMSTKRSTTELHAPIVNPNFKNYLSPFLNFLDLFYYQHISKNRYV